MPLDKLEFCVLSQMLNEIWNLWEKIEKKNRW